MLLDRLNTSVDEFVRSLTDASLVELIKISHKYRLPNCLNMKSSGRIKYDYVQFNARNVVFDIETLQPLDLTPLAQLQELELYKTAWYYIPFQKRIQHEHKKDFQLEVYSPIYFNPDGVFTYVPNVDSVLNTIFIDSSDVSTVQGFVLLSEGKHTLHLQQNQQVLILFDTQIFKNHPSRLYVQNTNVTIELIAHSPTVLYCFSEKNETQTFELDKIQYVLNYFYTHNSQKTLIRSKHFVEPIVVLTLSEG